MNSAFSLWRRGESIGLNKVSLCSLGWPGAGSAILLPLLLPLRAGTQLYTNMLCSTKTFSKEYIKF